MTRGHAGSSSPPSWEHSRRPETRGHGMETTSALSALPLELLATIRPPWHADVVRDDEEADAAADIHDTTAAQRKRKPVGSPPPLTWDDAEDNGVGGGDEEGKAEEEGTPVSPPLGHHFQQQQKQSSSKLGKDNEGLSARVKRNRADLGAVLAAAAVCTLWRAILAKEKALWRRVLKTLAYYYFYFGEVMLV